MPTIIIIITNKSGRVICGPVINEIQRNSQLGKKLLAGLIMRNGSFSHLSLSQLTEIFLSAIRQSTCLIVLDRESPLAIDVRFPVPVKFTFLPSNQLCSHWQQSLSPQWSQFRYEGGRRTEDNPSWKSKQNFQRKSKFSPEE